MTPVSVVLPVKLYYRHWKVSVFIINFAFCYVFIELVCRSVVTLRHTPPFLVMIAIVMDGGANVDVGL